MPHALARANSSVSPWDGANIDVADGSIDGCDVPCEVTIWLWELMHGEEEEEEMESSLRWTENLLELLARWVRLVSVSPFFGTQVVVVVVVVDFHTLARMAGSSRFDPGQGLF